MASIARHNQHPGDELPAELLRVIEALARAHVDEDYAAAQAELNESHQ